MARPGRPERNRPDHSTSVGDSVTSSTRMEVFGTHRWTALTMLSDRHQHFLSSALLAGNARQLPRGKYRDELVRRAGLPGCPPSPSWQRKPLAKSGSEKGPTQDVQCARNSLSQWCGKPPTTTERDWSRLCWRKILHLDIARAQAELPVS